MNLLHYLPANFNYFKNNQRIARSTQPAASQLSQYHVQVFHSIVVMHNCKILELIIPVSNGRRERMSVAEVKISIDIVIAMLQLVILAPSSVVIQV